MKPYTFNVRYRARGKSTFYVELEAESEDEALKQAVDGGGVVRNHFINLIEVEEIVVVAGAQGLKAQG